ncbi:MAG: acyltransferase [Alistipes sp.]|nr:acyltransferase [Alistipes sp.]
MINSSDIFAISTPEQFTRVALEIFRFQAENCPPYAEYLRLIGADIETVKSIEQIPMLPIELFKSHTVYSAKTEPQIVFTSSATTGMIPSRHAVADVSIYEQDFVESFRLFYGDVEQWSIYGLLPNYLQRSGSSLVYMVDRLIRRSGSGGFYLDNYQQLLDDMAADKRKKILIGVTYALLDLAEQYAPKLGDTIVMETGGMKGHRAEMSKTELHKVLCSAFGVERIHSEYGMAELMTQGYSTGEGLFASPPWMKVLTRDVNDPFKTLKNGRRGAINIIDLANIYSCSFIATQDMGIAYDDGTFRIEGRVTDADIRGCNLLVQ